MNDRYLAELSAVSKRFGSIVALDGLDLQVRSAELLAVLGPNGAGKSTAISLLLGLQQPDAGSARLFGQSPQVLEARRRIGVMMQEVTLSQELRVREQIDLVASYYPDPLTPDEAMQMTNTTALAARPYGKLSGGQKRQVQFAMALCGRPSLLFLDEPTVGLDVQARTIMWATLRQLVHDGCSIVLTTHYLEEAEALADRVVVLAKGRAIASGSVQEMRALVSRKHISCSTALAPDLVAAWPGVQSVSHDRGRLQIVASNADSVVRQLVAADAAFHELEVRSAGLAEAFTELTQEVASTL
jgi:ABC-type multidrug transport system ATPase subunit